MNEAAVVIAVAVVSAAAGVVAARVLCRRPGYRSMAGEPWLVTGVWKIWAQLNPGDSAEQLTIGVRDAEDQLTVWSIGRNDTVPHAFLGAHAVHEDGRVSVTFAPADIPADPGGLEEVP